jgi:hypothetical protein
MCNNMEESKANLGTNIDVDSSRQFIEIFR